MNWGGFEDKPEQALAHFLQELVVRKDRWLQLTPLDDIQVEEESAGPPRAPRAKRQHRPSKPTAAEKREAEAATASVGPLAQDAMRPHVWISWSGARRVTMWSCQSCGRSVRTALKAGLDAKGCDGEQTHGAKCLYTLQRRFALEQYSRFLLDESGTVHRIVLVQAQRGDGKTDFKVGCALGGHIKEHGACKSFAQSACPREPQRHFQVRRAEAWSTEVAKEDYQPT
eukprot:5075302-Amphidinium_carterae.1